MFRRQAFYLIISTLFLVLLLPVAALAQFSDLDTAIANLERGFGSGDVEAIVSGIASDDQVQLQFPGLADKSGFFGRDQAAYLLDGLFNKVKPSGFERVSAMGAGEGNIISRRGGRSATASAICTSTCATRTMAGRSCRSAQQGEPVVYDRDANAHGVRTMRMSRSAESASNNSFNRTRNQQVFYLSS